MFRQLIQPACAVLSWAGAVLMLALAPSAGIGQFGLEDQADANAKHVTFTATVEPSDPFSDMNDAARPKDKPLEFRRGDTFLLTIHGTLDKGWHTYPLTQRAPGQLGSQLSTLTIEGGANFQPIYPVRESAPQWKDDRSEYKNDPPPDAIYLEHDKPFTWTQEVYVTPKAPAGQIVTLPIKIKAQVCAGKCIQEVHTLQVKVAVASGEELPLTAGLKARLDVQKPPPPVVVPIPKEFAVAAAGVGAAPAVVSRPPPATKPKIDAGLLASVVNAVIGGLLSLLTPCVFPMIPITVSYFLKQSEKRKPAPVRALASEGIMAGGTAALVSSQTERQGSSALLLAAVYSGTIVLILTVGGLLLLGVLQQIIANPITNFALSGIFLFFALSLLGMYDITLPSWLQDRTSAGESKGGLVGAFFMALTFSIVSFACVGPIYGSFITLGASDPSVAGRFWKAVPPVLGFSMAFASPFFLLALFPSLLKSMPRAGSWMNSVKVVLGFLELAAAVKFLRTGELVLTKTSAFFTFDLCLAIYIALSLACGLYLLGVYRLPHDHEAPESIGVLRLMFSLSFITLSLYLIPGLFKSDDGESQRPRGEVFATIESFLLPDAVAQKTAGGSSKGGLSGKLVWHSKLKEALAEAARDNKLVFVDFTGVACTNCSKNERNVFSQPEVQAALSQHVLLKLYAEAGVPAGVDQQPDSPGAIELRNTVFGVQALPLYALLKPKGDSFEIVRNLTPPETGLISDVPAFVKGLENK